MPVVWFVIFTFLSVILARKIKDSGLFVFIFLLLSYFAGSFSFILTLMQHGTVNGSSTLLPLPAMHSMSNLPYAFSLLPFLVILILLKNNGLDMKETVMLGISIFLIMGLKFYGGVIAIFMVIVSILLKVPRLGRDQNWISPIGDNSPIRLGMTKATIYLIIIGLFIISSIFLFYDPFRSIKTGSIFGWAPFALVHTITEEPNQFYLRNLTDARYYILAQGRIGPRFIWIEFVNLSLFLFFYLGTRFFAIFYIFYNALRRKLDKFDYSVILTILFSILLTITLVQKAEWWNTIQFFFYAIFLLTIYLSKLVFDFIKSKKKLLVVLGFVLIVLSLPASIDLIRLFAAVPGAAFVSRDEMQALNFLRLQPSGVALTPLYNEKWKDRQKPNNLHAYADTAYVAAFSGKQEYFANILQLRLTGVPYEKRLEKMKKMDCSILADVDYVYEIRKVIDGEKIMVKCKPENSRKIFENKEINIYSITK